jgi:hypothetical protein
MGRTESEENAVREPGRPVSRDQLTRWAESCLRMQHLDDLVQRTIWDASPAWGKFRGLGLHNIKYPKLWGWQAVGEGCCIRQLELPILRI